MNLNFGLSMKSAHNLFSLILRNKLYAQLLYQVDFCEFELGLNILLGARLSSADPIRCSRSNAIMRDGLGLIYSADLEFSAGLALSFKSSILSFFGLTVCRCGLFHHCIRVECIFK